MYLPPGQPDISHLSPLKILNQKPIKGKYLLLMMISVVEDGVVIDNETYSGVVENGDKMAPIFNNSFFNDNDLDADVIT